MLGVLTGSLDEYGNELEESETRRSYLPMDKFSVLKSVSEQDFLADPWGEAYLYNYPRPDGHAGYLLFSKGPDKKAQVSEETEDGMLTKTPEDMDNIPSSEPGKWL